MIRVVSGVLWVPSISTPFPRDNAVSDCFRSLRSYLVQFCFLKLSLFGHFLAPPQLQDCKPLLHLGRPHSLSGARLIARIATQKVIVDGQHGDLSARFSSLCLPGACRVVGPGLPGAALAAGLYSCGRLRWIDIPALRPVYQDALRPGYLRSDGLPNQPGS